MTPSDFSLLAWEVLGREAFITAAWVPVYAWSGGQRLRLEDDGCCLARCPEPRFWTLPGDDTTDVWPLPCGYLATPMPDGTWCCRQHIPAWHARHADAEGPP